MLSAKTHRQMLVGREEVPVGALGVPPHGTRLTPQQFLASQRITSRDWKCMRLYLQ